MHSSNPDKFVKKKGEFLEALTETSVSILEKYELNIEQELILRRNGASLSRLKSLFNCDDVKSAIRYFSGAIEQATDLNGGAVDNIRWTEDYIRRLVYSNLITSLETFLSDFLLAYVRRDSDSSQKWC